jgi:hypothetical protein
MRNTTSLKPRVLVTIGALAAWFTGTAHAVPVSSGGTFLHGSPAPAYLSPASLPPGVWDMITTLSNCRVNDDTGTTAYRFSVADGVNFTWTGSQLNQDLSFDPTPGNTTNDDSMAEATFNGGGTLTVTGKLRNAAGTAVVFDGLLLQATVSSFHLRETGISDDRLHSIESAPGVNIRFTPTGGYLYDTATVAQLRGTYDFAMIAAVMIPAAGGNLDNFGTDLVSTSTLLMSYNLVPEPASLLVMIAGVALLGRRRRFEH